MPSNRPFAAHPAAHPAAHVAALLAVRLAVLLATVLGLTPGPVWAQAGPGVPPATAAGPAPEARSTAIYYKGLDFGTQRTFNPLSVVLNTGFDVFQFTNHDIRFARYPYVAALRRVGRSLGSPFKTVADQGWGRFLRTEIFPLHFTTHDAAWVPNYTLHLIGLGQSYAALDEFYRQHGVPAARPLAALTAMGAGVLNEMAESNGGELPPSPAMVADVYVFNVGGVLLFSSETVRRFFAEKLMLADWSSMPTFMTDGTLQNPGQYFVVKIPLPKVDDTRFFARFGLSAILGLTRTSADGTAWSAGIGRTGVKHFIQPGTGVEDIDMDWTAGLFYDRDNSLLMSLIWARNTRSLVSLNVYPGLLPGVGRDVGLWLAVDDAGRPRLGLTAGRFAGLGIGHVW